MVVNFLDQSAPLVTCSPFGLSLTVLLQVGAFVYHGTVIKKQVIVVTVFTILLLYKIQPK